jgi:DivIVA domain-containing protein
MIYRSGDRLGPHQVRAETFGPRRRGLNPDEVYASLRRVADEMDQLMREAITARTESERIRQGLRQWQSRHVGCKFADPPLHPHHPPSRHPGRRSSWRPSRHPGPCRSMAEGIAQAPGWTRIGTRATVVAGERAPLGHPPAHHNHLARRRRRPGHRIT